jgi:multidrug efflux pump subunit AcrA (membrane-fusion protein)
MNDRRRFSAEDLSELGDVLDRKLGERLSLKKNGHTWPEYFAKSLTPERLLHIGAWVVVLAFTFGGDLRQAREQLRTAANKADIASTKADIAAGKSEAAATKAEAAALASSELQQQIADLHQEMEDQKNAQAVFRSDVTRQLAMIPTRRELRDAIDLAKAPK